MGTEKPLRCKEVNMNINIAEILGNMTKGSLMYYGGYLGIGISVVLFLICLVAFPIRRKHLLKKLGRE